MVAMADLSKLKKYRCFEVTEIGTEIDSQPSRAFAQMRQSEIGTFVKLEDVEALLADAEAPHIGRLRTAGQILAALPPELEYGAIDIEAVERDLMAQRYARFRDLHATANLRWNTHNNQWNLEQEWRSSDGILHEWRRVPAVNG